MKEKLLSKTCRWFDQIGWSQLIFRDRYIQLWMGCQLTHVGVSCESKSRSSRELHGCDQFCSTETLQIKDTVRNWSLYIKVRDLNYPTAKASSHMEQTLMLLLRFNRGWAGCWWFQNHVLCQPNLPPTICQPPPSKARPQSGCTAAAWPTGIPPGLYL